jgi:origin recognition complex subunit 4
VLFSIKFQAPICIVGVTCRLDVTELLEKRVRSRFSHRQILLLPESGGENSFVSIATDLLSLPKKALKCPGDKKIIAAWNDTIKNVLSNIEVTSILRQIMDINKNERVFRNFLVKLALTFLGVTLAWMWSTVQLYNV